MSVVALTIENKRSCYPETGCKVIVVVKNGMVDAVYSNDEKTDVCVIDLDTDDEKRRLEAEREKEMLDLEIASGIQHSIF